MGALHGRVASSVTFGGTRRQRTLGSNYTEEDRHTVWLGWKIKARAASWKEKFWNMYSWKFNWSSEVWTLFVFFRFKSVNEVKVKWRFYFSERLDEQWKHLSFHYYYLIYLKPSFSSIFYKTILILCITSLNKTWSPHQDCSVLVQMSSTYRYFLSESGLQAHTNQVKHLSNHGNVTTGFEKWT